jgi:hypothetical protein
LADSPEAIIEHIRQVRGLEDPVDTDLARVSADYR